MDRLGDSLCLWCDMAMKAKRVMKRGWKVTFGDYNESAMVDASHDTGCVRYPFGEWACPHIGCGPLSIFEHYEDATDFVRLWGSSSHRISECWYVPSKQGMIWNGRRSVMPGPELPFGTILADAVYLIPEAA